jgi:hypothetical protein
VPPAEEEATAAAHADRAEDIPEALMFDKAEEAESLEQARYQIERVADEIEATKRARDGAPPERRAAFDERLAILETQRARFAERAERMAAAADASKQD